jgi:hypothetical protein
MCEVICRAGLVVFPRDFPVFVRASRLHDELLAGELERTGQIFADQSAHQGAFDVEGESMGAFVDFERTKGWPRTHLASTAQVQREPAAVGCVP